MIIDPTARLDTLTIEDSEGSLPYIIINKTDFDPSVHRPLGMPSKKERVARTSRSQIP